MANCEQTINNISTLLNSMANTQGNNTSDIVQIKQDLDFLAKEMVKTNEQVSELVVGVTSLVESLSIVNSNVVDTNSVSKSILKYLNKLQDFLGV